MSFTIRICLIVFFCFLCFWCYLSVVGVWCDGGDVKLLCITVIIWWSSLKSSLFTVIMWSSSSKSLCFTVILRSSSSKFSYFGAQAGLDRQSRMVWTGSPGWSGQVVPEAVECSPRGCGQVVPDGLDWRLITTYSRVQTGSPGGCGMQSQRLWTGSPGGCGQVVPGDLADFPKFSYFTISQWSSLS